MMTKKIKIDDEDDNEIEQESSLTSTSSIFETESNDSSPKIGIMNVDHSDESEKDSLNKVMKKPISRR